MLEIRTFEAHLSEIWIEIDIVDDLVRRKKKLEEKKVESWVRVKLKVVVKKVRLQLDLIQPLMSYLFEKEMLILCRLDPCSCWGS